MNTLTRLVLGANLALCPIALCYANAHVDAASGARMETVRYDDLDITQSSGAATLYRRLKGAARNVCRDFAPGRQLERVPAYQKCVRTALANAIVAVDRPVVTRYAREHGGLPPEPVTIAATR